MLFRFALLFAVLACKAAASDTLEFRAYMHTAGHEFFVLRDLTVGKNSDWLTNGESFGGYTITRFDRAAETLTVMTFEQTLTLPLRMAKVRPEATPDEQAADLATRLEMAKQILTKLRFRYREAHPLVKAHLRTIAEMERRLAALSAKN
ncbi:MAG: hypothetical protein HZA93_04525 [Verrucomicrobia bacterium]|nr:hypothetical protein [Verrucomicrobiota bacterium]